MKYDISLTNREKQKDFYIDENWYKNRQKGISAFIRCGNEQTSIGQCLDSIVEFFDEIIISFDSNDKTEQILNNFCMTYDHIKLYKYPFMIKDVNGYAYDDSVHSNSFYYNWTMSKTTKTHVCKYDADMLMLPWFLKHKKDILNNFITWVRGVNIVQAYPTLLSKNALMEAIEPRFFKVKQNMFYILNKKMWFKKPWKPKCKHDIPIYKYKYKRFGKTFLYGIIWLNSFFGNQNYYLVPSYFHTKFLKPSFNVDKWKYELNNNNSEFIRHFLLQPSNKINVLEIPDSLLKHMRDYL